MSRIRRTSTLVIHSYMESTVRRARAEAGFVAVLCAVAVGLSAIGVPVAELGMAMVGAVSIGRYVRFSEMLEDDN